MKNQRIHLLHTNDIHSRLDQTGKMDHFLNRKRREWEETGESYLLVDVGDHMDRMRWETEGTDGHVNRAILEKMGYDAVTFGNNELLTFSKQQLDSLFKKASFSIVSSNVKELKTGEVPAWIHPHLWIQRQGVMFCLLGATIPYDKVYALMGWMVEEPINAVKREVDKVRKKADVVILLSHLGYRTDQILAEEVPGIDLILGAHTHHLLEKPVCIGSTYIAAAGQFGEHIGHLVLEWNHQSRRLLGVTGQTYSLEDEPSSDEISQLITRYKKAARRTLDVPISFLRDSLSIDWYQESELGNLLADAIRDWVGSDAAIVNSGQILDHLPAGEVTWGMLHRICPHPINPVIIRIKGEELWQALEESLLPEFMDKHIRGFGFRGKRLGMLSVSGMDIEYDPQGEPYKKIRNIHIGDQLLEKKKMYEIGSIDMFQFGVGYLSLKNGETVRHFLPEFLRDLLAKRLQQEISLENLQQKRWRIVS